MDPSSQLDRIEKLLKSLCTALWCLVAINVIAVGLSLARQVLITHLATSSSVQVPGFESWEGLTIEQKIARSSVILITETKREGDKVKGIIKEIPKHTPGTTFYYSVGDEYPVLSETAREHTSYGEGAIVLLEGSPAAMRESYPIYSGAVSGLGNMPMAKMRELLGK